jgi:hypothetical protein
MQENTKGPSVFISYSHRDKESVVPLVSHLRHMGFQVWMDTKDLAAGDSIIEEVSNAIARADIYIVALSAASIVSKWVIHELNTALSLEIGQGHPRVIPVMLEKVNVPAAIKARLYVDLSAADIREANRKVDAALREHAPSVTSHAHMPTSPMRLDLAKVALGLRERTKKYFGGTLGNAESRDEVREEAADLAAKLRRRAHGVLLNFVAASEMDFRSPHPRFPNGELTTTIRDSEGDLVGTIGREVTVQVEVINPDQTKLDELVSSKLLSLGVARATYTFLLSPEIDNLAQLALAKLQKKYVILSWDAEEGAEIELPDDLRLCVFASNDRIRIGISTEYVFQFEKRAKQFSVREFVAWLLDS